MSWLLHTKLGILDTPEQAVSWCLAVMVKHLSTLSTSTYQSLL